MREIVGDCGRLRQRERNDWEEIVGDCARLREVVGDRDNESEAAKCRRVPAPVSSRRFGSTADTVLGGGVWQGDGLGRGVGRRGSQGNLPQSPTISLNLPQSPTISHKLGRRGSQDAKGSCSRPISPNLPQSPSISHRRRRCPRRAARARASSSSRRARTFPRRFLDIS